MTGGVSPERTSAASPAAASPAAASPVAASSAAAPPISGALSAESSVAYVQRECWPVGRLTSWKNTCPILSTRAGTCLKTVS